MTKKVQTNAKYLADRLIWQEVCLFYMQTQYKK